MPEPSKVQEDHGLFLKNKDKKNLNYQNGGKT